MVYIPLKRNTNHLGKYYERQEISTPDTQSMTEVVGIIPAAGDPKGLWFPNDQDRTDSMVPISGKPAIYWTLNSFISIGIKKVCIVVKKRGTALEEFVETLFSNRIQTFFTELTHSTGVGHSIVEGTRNFPPGTPTLVVLGDTILWNTDLLQLRAESIATVADVEDPSRWCIAEISDRKIQKLANKPKISCSHSKALTGIYYFEKGIHITRELQDRIDSRSNPIEMSDLLQPLIDASALFAVEDSHWLDVGNPDHVYRAHSTLLQSRAFNHLTIDGTKGTICKRSKYSSKFYDEINYFKLLPENLKIFFPRVINQSTEPNNLSIESEFYAYPTLGDLFLFQDLPQPIWRRTFEKLRSIFIEFSSRNYGLNRESGRQIYLEKNQNRVELFLSQANAEIRDFLCSKTLRINKVKAPALDEAFERSASLLKEIAETTTFTPIHGDLCFSNILCEPSQGLIKLIDPRGSFGEKGILGDPRYDLAKLTHSALGLYDFIVSDLCQLEMTGNEVYLSFPKPHSIASVSDQFSATFLNDSNRKEVGLITAWLFLSMLPLHNDSPQRQISLAIRGLQLLTKALE
jgi:dTDP-glucose pyrophosphorylase